MLEFGGDRTFLIRPLPILPPPQQDRIMPSIIKTFRTHAFAGASRLALLAVVVGSSLALGGCGNRLQQFTGSLGDLGRGPSTETRTDPIADLARRYDAKPGEKRVSLDYAAALRANGQHPQAVAVLQRASIVNVGDRDVAAAYGKALVEIGRLEEASQVLAQAHSEDRPNWRVLSTLGSIADQTGDHARARDLYTRALQIAPNEPSVLNNLGLSYVLTKELAKAEEILRQAVSQPGADPRIQANLDLALKLQSQRPARPGAAPALTAAAVPAQTTTAPAVRPRSVSTTGSLWKAPQAEMKAPQAETKAPAAAAE